MTILGPNENIKSLTREDLLDYVKENYTPERMVLSAAGGVSHSELVAQAKSLFGGMKTGTGRAELAKASFTGSDLRARFDNHPTAHIVMAVEGVSWTHPRYFPLLVMQSIIGSWSRSMGASSHASSSLAQVLKAQPYKSFGYLANSFMAFNTSYTDTGLFGIYAETEAFTYLDDLVHHIQREWHRLALNVGEAEVFRAKNQLKTALLMSLDGLFSKHVDKLFRKYPHLRGYWPPSAHLWQTIHPSRNRRCHRGGHGKGRHGNGGRVYLGQGVVCRWVRPGRGFARSKQDARGYDAKLLLEEEA